MISFPLGNLCEAIAKMGLGSRELGNLLVNKFRDTILTKLKGLDYLRIRIDNFLVRKRREE